MANILEAALEVRQSRGDLPKSWAPFYVCLRPDGIYYYKEKGDKTFVATIPVSQVEDVENLAMKKKGESGSTFEVKTTDKVRTQHKCPDGKAVELWVYKIDKTKSGDLSSSKVSEESDEIDEAMSPTGTMVVKSNSLKAETGASLAPKSPRERSKSSSGTPRKKKDKENTREKEKKKSKKDKNSTSKSTDSENYGTMQIKDISTLEMRKSGESFMDHVEEVKLKEREAKFKELSTEDLQLLLNEGLHKQYQEEYESVIEEWAEAKEKALAELERAEKDEIRKRIQSQKDQVKSKLRKLEKAGLDIS